MTMTVDSYQSPIRFQCEVISLMVLMNMLIASSHSRQLSALLHDSEPPLPFIGTVID